MCCWRRRLRPYFCTYSYSAAQIRLRMRNYERVKAKQHGNGRSNGQIFGAGQRVKAKDRQISDSLRVRKGGVAYDPTRRLPLAATTQRRFCRFVSHRRIDFCHFAKLLPSQTVLLYYTRDERCRYTQLHTRVSLFAKAILQQNWFLTLLLNLLCRVMR